MQKMCYTENTFSLKIKQMIYLNALNKIPGIGPQKMKLLMNRFGDSKKVWESDLSEIMAGGINEKLAQIIIRERVRINPELEWEKLTRENIRLIDFDSPDYPRLLKEIPSAPYLIYYKGDYDFNSRPLLAIVGSRKFTTYGQQVALSLARDLAGAGITVVSGMALGIDTFAHRGALEAGGQTLAVLGSSLEDSFIGPRTNFNLSRQIIANGALLSDYPPGTQATAQTFPARNRLMAGLTTGTIVVEAAQQSGTLITANMALDFNREVFSVPGNIFSPVSQGTNSLIKQGAKIITGVNDILEELNLTDFRQEKKIQEIIPASKEEEIILQILSNEPQHIDRIIKLSKINTSIVSSTLIILEMKGYIKDMGGQNYIRY
ncbi:MAG: DNA-protecting protein DprA [Sphingobacteriia bacterium]|nr:DNA-protecting protein DprA [Sphingobacteriia bacterium]